MVGDRDCGSNDPYAVRITFRAGPDALDWVFARSLLIGGLTEPTGGGDVEVRPSRRHGVATVQIALQGPGAHVVLEAPARFIAAFVRRTCAGVPPGTEHHHIGLDHLARQFLRHVS
ncbi:SsgA family sporulation/cell division regulator [Streptomyces sp. Ru72]|uniref:SsgA family sporulation/cell division regulator n=1 Tax=Streptomyces sp. Ru72 TaxID=2080747 RepID=UPI000CDD4330|nr:SsgA family sporulation/cell division regulator [Streptomyces sp. Ru72]POX51555.1 SsgA family sporulation/cell division regulator [Streptomyces sp. Ru72]